MKSRRDPDKLLGLLFVLCMILFSTNSHLIWKPLSQTVDWPRDHSQVLDDIDSELRVIWRQQKLLKLDVEDLFEIKLNWYHRSDLEAVFNVRYVPGVELWPQELEESVNQRGFEDAWDINSWYEAASPEERLIYKNEPVMDSMLNFNGNPLTMERRYYAKWVNKEMGYGIFSNMIIEPYSILDFYSGVVQCHSVLFDAYSWTHPASKIVNSSCTVTAGPAGNLLRLVNDNPNYINLMNVHAINRNRAYFLYAAKRDPIYRNQQLLISYGDHYWTAPGAKNLFKSSP